ncbi:TetR/AcrR family transcriptional regulator [Rhodococcus sp. HNM0569]|uniref:TetR/AcrR family transcriptional regulator n=1 Tax=Rhodococcus sp. HNM0569 TaxID=2716340 RepID=UPI00146C7C18|nr:TetR/AcrR family transcriptional regulator [Rhodococcus sp. HNM0569]NLU84560.1 TetR/AcrR family transcriptional regulator [Rhodococcus sp. HNM0569]
MVDSDDVINAARAVVRRVGIGALTLADVAREAGISRATIYRRYASKDRLVAFVVTWELDSLERLVLGRLRFADEPRQTVYMLVREVLDHNAGNDALQAALRIDGSALTPWLIRSAGHETLVDVVTDRALSHVVGSALAEHLKPNPQAAVEFMVSAIYAELLSPARHMTHAELASYITDAVCPA